MSGRFSGQEIRRALDEQLLGGTDRAGRDASERLASMAVLAAGAAHDMVGPLTYVLSNLEYLDVQLATHERDLAPGRSGELRQCLREAILGATRVRDIVRELPCGAAATTETDIDLQHLLLSCIKVARTEIDHRARVITEFDAIPSVLGSEPRLSRLFLNLLVNAAQAVAGSPEREHFIRVVTRNEAGRVVVVEISDSGPGIPEENLTRVFEPFFSTKPASEGTGLGLSICRCIVEELGGTLSLESTVGRGSTFRVTLPARVERPTERVPKNDGRFAPSEPPVRRLPLRQLG
jgi:two-component system, NtrC family, sensor kinase